MRHSFIDKYSELDSFIHRIDSRIKLILTFIFIISIALTPAEKFIKFGFFFLFIFLLTVFSKIPLRYSFRRSLIIIPFVLLVTIFIPFINYSIHGYSSKYLLIWNVFIKSFLSVWSLTWLTTTVPFTELLKALEKMNTPKIFILILSFMYRYIFVLIDEIERMERAWKSRDIGSNLKGKVIIFSGIIGVLFIRTYERAERVYQSMLNRGFNGEIKTIKKSRKFQVCDFLFFFFFISIIISVSIWF